MVISTRRACHGRLSSCSRCSLRRWPARSSPTTRATSRRRSEASTARSVTPRSRFDESSKKFAGAVAALKKAQRQLDAAEAHLGSTRGELATAEARDAQMQAELVKSEAELDAAIARLDAGQEGARDVGDPGAAVHRRVVAGGRPRPAGLRRPAPRREPHEVLAEDEPQRLRERRPARHDAAPRGVEGDPEAQPREGAEAARRGRRRPRGRGREPRAQAAARGRRRGPGRGGRPTRRRAGQGQEAPPPRSSARTRSGSRSWRTSGPA